MTLRLHESTHDAEGHQTSRCVLSRGIVEGVSRRRRQGGDDGVIGAFVGTDLVRVSIRKMEAGSAVLHGDPPVWNHHPASESGVVALDERHAPSFGIRTAEENRPSGFWNSRIELSGSSGIHSFGE